MVMLMTRCKLPADVKRYINFVHNHEDENCEWTLKFCDLVTRIFENENLFYDESRIEKYFTYQKYFPYDLFLWEKCLFVLHNCVFREDGYPRWPDLLCIVGRGAGKNGYLSFEDFCLLSPTHGIKNYNIDIYATSEDQAKTTFKEIYEVLEANEMKLKKFFTWNKEIITNIKTNSSLRFRTRNADTKDGGRPGKNDFDEKHAYENFELIDVANTGLGKIKHPRTTSISTQGDVRDGPLDDDVQVAKDILDGKTTDNGLLPFLCMLDSKDEVNDERMWNKANPSLRYRPDLLEQMRKEYVAYLRHPDKSRAFIVKRMNLIEERKDIAVTSWDNILATNRKIPDLEGYECIAAIDYARTSDFVSAGLLFKKNNIRYWVTHAWFCKNSRDKHRIKVDLKMMEDMGVLTIIDDIEIKPEIVIDWLYEQQRKYRIKKICMDNFRITLFSTYLKKIGFDAKDKKRVKLVRPSDIMKIYPSIDSWFMNKIIVWGDDPFMRWCTNNAKVVPMGKDNFVYDKQEPKSRKTDGFMAFVAAATCDEELIEYVEMPPLDVIEY
jgi:phage terminase large subunit-like protein|uniref:Large Terminase n=1 Tax=Siphoviridae sp. ctQtc11 TaxID=2825497 RepID=A0A8S5P4R3_9CAUD|nr:MAG TPA: Large Terminase [Siphoviridae sp. ctQtc11]